LASAKCYEHMRIESGSNAAEHFVAPPVAGTPEVACPL
jgi:hypothetical protein